VIKFPRSVYYSRIKQKSVGNKYQRENEKIKELIMNIWIESKERYGAPKIHRKIMDNGKKISIKRIQRLMREMGVKSKVVKKYRYHSEKPDCSGKENILKGDFSADRINEKWVTDITYIYTSKDGWTYLASVEDLFSRKIIGYSYGKKITAELAVQAVKNACLNVKNTNGIVIHSDQGRQYTSDIFEKYLKIKNMIHSYSRKGNPYDNASIESFHSILKKEEVNHMKYRDFEQASKSIFEFIESWYNRKRIHSSIDYLTPDQAHCSIA